MSSDSNDNHANKRQRTDAVHDSRVVVNVGGKLFPTFRSTLTMKSTYFSKRLSGRFSDAGDSEIIVDRDHEPFSIILSYLRSGVLSVPTDQLTLRLVLIEADFYGIDELVDMVRDKCYCNLNHINYSEDDSDALVENYTKEFPTYKHIINHAFFPSLYFDKVNYYRVMSTHVLPENKYARLIKLDDTVDYVEVWQSVTYECLLTHTVFVEPLLCLRHYAPSWMSQKSPTDWRETGNTFTRQLVPVSFWLGYNKDIFANLAYSNKVSFCTKS